MVRHAERERHLPNILQTFARVQAAGRVHQRLFGSLSQLDAGVTTVHDVSQINHRRALRRRDPGHHGFGAPRRLRLFRECGGRCHTRPDDAVRIRSRVLLGDQLVTMIMGGEVYLGVPTYSRSWTIGRQLDLKCGAHPLSVRDPSILDLLAGARVASTTTSGSGRQSVHPYERHVRPRLAGRQRRGRAGPLAVPIEMNMRHGMPPILKMQSLGMEPF